jgi:hypothetical protein
MQARPRRTMLQVCERMFAACLTLFLGIYFVGRGYPHLCEAGSRTLEGIGMMGIPVAAAVAVGLCRRWRVGLAIATALLALDYLAREPYLQWVHGPNSPWPGIQGSGSR